jgi:hypothetical protein
VSEKLDEDMTTSKEVHMRALRRAAQELGSVEALRAHLRVSMSQLAGWLHGEARLPDAVFLKVVDLLSEQQLTALKLGMRNHCPG